MPETIGFIGLGNMGGAMAARLLEKGWQVRVWNRTRKKAEPLVERGGVSVERPEDTAEPGGIVISMLADDDAVSRLLGPDSPVVSRLGKNGVHISMSTIHPDTARRLAGMHQSSGTIYVAAPVFGRPDAAASGTLWIAVSGQADARRRVRPLLDALSRGVFQFGDDPGAANVTKLCANFLIAAAVESLGEVAALADKSGVGAAPMLEMFSQTLFACPVYQGYGKMIVNQKFEPAGFRLRLGLKDVELAIAAARSVEMSMPIAGLVRDRLLAGLNKGRADWDWTSVVLESREAAGL